jgi:Ca-activated chloride channel family protein
MIQFLSFILFLGLVYGQDKGKKAYEEGKYDDAREYYEHVLKNRKQDEAAQFGLGATAYQLKDMETAARSLNNVMNSDDKSLASKAMYNLGNMFRDQEKMEESLALYRKSIELDPTDQDAKVNYELLKQVLQKQEQQQNKESEQNEDKEQEKQDQDSKNKDKQNQDQDNQGKNEEQQKKENQNSESDQEKENKEQEQFQAKQEESQEQKSDKQMQADAILNALKDKEKINQKRQIAKAKSHKLEKDW